MQKKPNYKVMAVCWIISGIVSVILGIILINVANEASPYTRREREAAQLIKIVSVVFLGSGTGEFISGCVFAGKAANESSNSNDKYSDSSYNSDLWKNNSDSTKLNSYHISQSGPTVNVNFWKCPKCGKINANYVGTCGCGERQGALKPTYNAPEESKPLHSIPASEPVVVANPVVEPEKTSSQVAVQSENKVSGDKFCPYCGSAVKSGHIFCHECGSKLD